MWTACSTFGRKQDRRFGNGWLWQASTTCTLRDGPNTPRGRAQHFRPAQQAAMSKIEQYVSWFLKNDHKADVDWATKLKRIRLDHHGEEVKVPQCITWSAIKPSTSGTFTCHRPLRGLAGRGDAGPSQGPLAARPMASRAPGSQGVGRV